MSDLAQPRRSAAVPLLKLAGASLFSGSFLALGGLAGAALAERYNHDARRGMLAGVAFGFALERFVGQMAVVRAMARGELGIPVGVSSPAPEPAPAPVPTPAPEPVSSTPPAPSALVRGR